MLNINQTYAVIGHIREYGEWRWPQSGLWAYFHGTRSFLYPFYFNPLFQLGESSWVYNNIHTGAMQFSDSLYVKWTATDSYNVPCTVQMKCKGCSEWENTRKGSCTWTTMASTLIRAHTTNTLPLIYFNHLGNVCNSSVLCCVVFNARAYGIYV